jgi:hypothetical protein
VSLRHLPLFYVVTQASENLGYLHFESCFSKEVVHFCSFLFVRGELYSGVIVRHDFKEDRISGGMYRKSAVL